LRTDCFDLGQNLFSWTKIDMISFDGADSGMKAQTFWFHSCFNVGRFVERFWKVCS
jgi:hypothetical protein